MAQIIVKITALPADTPQNAALYLASDLNVWNPQDKNFTFSKGRDGGYSLIIPEALLKNSPQFSYKITQGNWENAEGDQNGNPTDNHIATLLPGSKIINAEILSWVKPVEKTSTASKNVRVLSENFFIPQLNSSRKIWIYLPQDYTTTTDRFPVFYMEDGQNLFDSALAPNGEWKVDETLDKIFSDGKPDAIIIGISNGGTERLNEYSPWKNLKYGGGKGDLYADFLAKTLKPFIDKNYRTLPQAKYTGLIGSSMGGLISLYTGLTYPTKFGRLGIFSPSIWFAKPELKLYINKNRNKLRNSKFYFVAGTKESAEMVPDILEIVPMLLQKGVSLENIKTKFDDYGTHSENYWSQEFGAAYEWLLK